MDPSFLHSMGSSQVYQHAPTMDPSKVDKGRFVEGGEGEGRFLDRAERERGFVNGQEEIEFEQDAGS